MQTNKDNQAVEIGSVAVLEQPSSQASRRLFFLDLLKAVCITAVVSYHAVFVPRTSYTDSLNLMEVLFAPLRFCVPVLLTISFLLFERGMARQVGPVWPSLRKRLMRLAIPTVFWFSLVLCLKAFRGSTPEELIGEVLSGNIFQGAYYLLVLFQFVLVFPWIRNWFGQLRNVVITVFLQFSVFLSIYALLLQDNESQVLIALKSIGRPNFIYWLVYMALGVYFARHLPQAIDFSRRLSQKRKTLLLGGTAVLMGLEYHWLLSATKGSVPPFDYVLVTCVLSVLVAFLCFACVEETQLPAPVTKAVSLLANYSLGIFCCNGILSEVFLSLGTHAFAGATFDFPVIFLLKLAGWGFLLTVSLGLSILLDRLGLGVCVR